jgi:anti-sigma B factor antagonist
MAAAPKPLRIEVESRPEGAVVRIAGAASLDVAHRIQAKLQELAAQKVPLVVLDLDGLEFVSSLGLGAIIAGHLKVRQYAGEVRIARPQPAILQLLQTTRLTKLMAVFPTVEEALRASKPAE